MIFCIIDEKISLSGGNLYSLACSSRYIVEKFCSEKKTIAAASSNDFSFPS